MRKMICHIMLLLIAGFFFPALGQDSISIDLSFNQNDFSLLRSGDDLLRIEAGDDSYFYSEEPEFPAIPFRSVDVLIPEGADLVDFHFSFESENYPQDIRLSRNVLPLPISHNPEDSPRLSTTAFSGVFPQQVVKYNSRQIMQGYTWLNFTITPFLYDSNTETLSLIKQLELHITYSQKKDAQASSIRENQVMPLIRDRVQNPGDLDRLYPDKKKAEEKSSSAPLDYLIVTTTSLKEGFQPLIEWKQRKGLKAETITLEEIYSMYDEASPQLEIKRCLQEYYESRRLKWVLLGGDFDLVPAQACFGSVGMDRVDNTIPADLFYACFDKSFDWNANVDDKFGEPYWDYVDILPEIFVARAPVNNLEQLEVFVNKSLEYEMNTPTVNFAERILLSGVKSWNIWDGQSDNHHRNERMYSAHVNPRWPGEKFGFYDTGSDFPGADTYQVNIANLSDQINSGYNIFHFAGHGNHSSIHMEEGAGFSLNEAFALNNMANGIMLSSSCDINAFDIGDPCLSEALLRNPDGGCVAFWGSSRYGWGNPDMSSVLGPSFLYNAKFLEYLFSDDIPDQAKTFAGLTSMAKATFSGNGTAAGAYWFLQYSLNAMGDPELPLYSRNPSVFDNVRIYSWENQTTVNTGGVKGCKICITSADLEEGFQELTIGEEFTLIDIPESYQVTISKANYLPYVFKSRLTSDKWSEYISDLQVYPNPATDFVNLDFKLPQGLLSLYDLNGRIQKEMELSSGTNTLSLSGLPEGAYILKLSSIHGTAHIKLIKK